MTAIILAGGRATRMEGRDKAFLKVGGRSLITRQVALLGKLFKKIIIVTNSPAKCKDFKMAKIVTDVIPHQGPLGGIYAGLLASEDDYNFVVACDMPFINDGLIKYLVTNIDANDVIIPKVNKRFHPLFGIYSKNCIPIIEDLLRKGRLKISNLFRKVETRFISRKELARFDKDLLSLININNPKDLTKAKRLMKQR